MDKLTIFPADSTSKVSLESDNGNTLDDLIQGFNNILEQLRMTHLGHELHLWGKEVNEKNL